MCPTAPCPPGFRSLWRRWSYRRSVGPAPPPRTRLSGQSAGRGSPPPPWSPPTSVPITMNSRRLYTTTDMRSYSTTILQSDGMQDLLLLVHSCVDSFFSSHSFIHSSDCCLYVYSVVQEMFLFNFPCCFQSCGVSLRLLYHTFNDFYKQTWNQILKHWLVECF